MKTDELRLNNLLNFNSETISVALICDDGAIGYRNGDTLTCLPSNSFKPIPITEEWLLKAGFEKDETDWWYIDDFGVKRYDNDCFVFYTLNTIIKFLHQLQNLYFALTGEELTINQ